ncbi:MAG: 30S ribosomal protein S12 methylthiotransferase RimO [Lachnospiraceae bacterium]|nr:30S ribosomal protein S12 methylthiotransferase RimO [Lachnospiraceae bacterium]
MNILFVSLGCDKNTVDSEVMLHHLGIQGHRFTDEEEQAEAVIVNTCCFIDAAKEESIDEILRFAERKKQGLIRALIVTGCLAQRYREEILREIPEVDAVVGVTTFDRIQEVLDEVMKGKEAPVCVGDADDASPVSTKRMITTGGHFEFLKIAEGCDKRCTYCIIPKIRGHYRSVPMEALLEEARSLAEAGVRELILVAQECTRYGEDLTGRKQLPELLKELCRIDGLHWIRVLYCYPEEITDELIDVIATEDKICKYLDLPIQSGSDGILRRMGRRIDRDGIISLVGRIRSRIPDVCLRTTLISGFPGETAQDHRQTMELVRELRFDHLGVFPYSQEEGTPAAAFPDQVSERVKKTRQTKLMKLQQEISRERNEELVGRIVEAVIEGRIDGEDAPDEVVYLARTMRDAPEVDGYLFIEGVDPSRDLLTGTFVRVRITGAGDYDLTGEMYEDESAE